MDYKHRLTDRFIDVIESLTNVDRDLALKMKTTDVEDLGILLAEAEKKLNRILESNPLILDEYQRKKLLHLQTKRIQSGRVMKN